jgi:cysteine synthase A
MISPPYTERCSACSTHVLDAIGKTPLIQLSKLAPESRGEVYAKCEALNPGGSLKDRAATLMIEDAVRKGEIAEGGVVIESSSGNMAIGLAQACLFFNLQFIAVVDPNINPHTKKIIQAYGADVVVVTEPKPEGGYIAARLEKVHELCGQYSHAYWPNQYGNPNNPKAHNETMREIVDALDQAPDVLFAATSTCGTLMGCAEYIQQHHLSTKLIAVDACGSVLFRPTEGTRRLPGHGAGQRSPLLDVKQVDEVVHVSDWDCVSGCHRLLRSEALLCGGSSGGVVTAYLELMEKLPESATTVLLLCDRGERYLDTVYSPSWVAEHLS